MSMFHELMMRKKEEIMYATIKGSLTESPEGVFSGFSSSNYLNLQENIIYTNNFEMLFKITTGTIGTNQTIFDGTTSSNKGATILISNNGNLFVSAGNGTWIVNTSGTTVLSANTTYYVKFSYKNGVYKLELSTDNITWNTEISVESSSIVSSTSNKSIGYSTRFNGRVFTGSIDLNNSYIKLGSTKYNLQAVVGYTVVGSPTITDGVASGFSASNYLSLPNINNISEGTPFNIITKISTPADYQGNWLLAFVTNNSRIFCISQAPVFRYLSNGTATALPFNYTMVFNTTYILEVKYNGNKLEVIIYDENKNILSSNEVEDTKVVFFNGLYTIGSNKNNQFFNGSINMNETYIKINNKLWFNGQQA